MQELHKRLRARLEALGWTCEDLAHRSAISLSLAEKLLSGERGDPRLSTAARICAAVGLPLQWLAGVGPNKRGKPRGSQRRFKRDEKLFARLWLAGVPMPEILRQTGMGITTAQRLKHQLSLPNRPLGWRPSKPKPETGENHG